MELDSPFLHRSYNITLETPTVVKKKYKSYLLFMRIFFWRCQKPNTYPFKQEYRTVTC